MLPATLDLTAYRGDTWSQSFRFMSGDEPFDFTGALVASEARDASGQRFPLDVEPGLNGP